MTPPSLAELQRLFWAAVAHGPGAECAPGAALIAVVAPGSSYTPSEGLRIYMDMYWWRLREVLQADFPRVAATLGEDEFTRLAGAYLAAHPSRHGSVRHVGQRFAQFLAGDARTPPYVHDLARLEWARVEVFDAPDAPALTASDLRRVQPVAWPTLRLATIPALAVVASAWPIHLLWRDDPPAPLEPHPTTVRVWRRSDGTVVHAPLDPRADAALDLVRAGVPFADVCSAFSDMPADEGARAAAALLARWIDDGMLRFAGH